MCDRAGRLRGLLPLLACVVMIPSLKEECRDVIDLVVGGYTWKIILKLPATPKNCCEKFMSHKFTGIRGNWPRMKPQNLMVVV